MNLRVCYLKDTEGVSYSSFDGAFLFYKEVIDYLHQSNDIDLRGHDASEIRSAVRSARPEDIFLSIGPYAYVHYFWRETEGKSFRIVRDISTWLWSGYWIQEEICASLSRPDDIVIFPSHFVRKFYLHHFPELYRCRCVVFYCALVPGCKSMVPNKGQRSGILYVGALSPAKGVETLVRISPQIKLGRRIKAYGLPNSEHFERWVSMKAINSKFYWKGPISRKDLGKELRKAECLVFPTVASRETLGRVILEAIGHGCPVIGTQFGALPEILPEDCLVPVEFIPGTYCMSKTMPLARINEKKLLDKLNSTSWKVPQLPAYYQINKLIPLLKNNDFFQTPFYTPKTEIWKRVDIKRCSKPSIEFLICAFESFFGNKELGSVGVPEIDDSTVAKNMRSIHNYRLFPKIIDGLVETKNFTISN